MKEKRIVYPNYEHSILNLINSILKHYEVPTEYKGLPELEEELNKNYTNLVLVILDGMGEHILEKASENGFFRQNQKTVLTSVCPSTTTAAMTTYYSGKPPYVTGWIAMSQYFKELRKRIANDAKV